MNTIHTLIDHLGGTRDVARQLQLPPSTVQGWKRTGRVPASRLVQLETVLGVPRHTWRPDLYAAAPSSSSSSSFAYEAPHV